MKFFYDLERKYQRYAIKNLMYYIVILYGIGLVLYMAQPYFYWNYLCLNPIAILHGQIWRIVTFLIYPPAIGSMKMTSVFVGVIALFMYYSLGQTLENIWGAFRFNVFFFMGVIGQVLASLVVYLLLGQ